MRLIVIYRQTHINMIGFRTQFLSVLYLSLILPTVKNTPNCCSENENDVETQDAISDGFAISENKHAISDVASFGYDGITISNASEKEGALRKALAINEERTSVANGSGVSRKKTATGVGQTISEEGSLIRFGKSNSKYVVSESDAGPIYPGRSDAFGLKSEFVPAITNGQIIALDGDSLTDIKAFSNFGDIHSSGQTASLLGVTRSEDAYSDNNLQEAIDGGPTFGEPTTVSETGNVIPTSILNEGPAVSKNTAIKPNLGENAELRDNEEFSSVQNDSLLKYLNMLSINNGAYDQELDEDNRQIIDTAYRALPTSIREILALSSENGLAITDSNPINLDNGPAMPNGITTSENDDAIEDSFSYNNNGPSIATRTTADLDEKSSIPIYNRVPVMVGEDEKVKTDNSLYPDFINEILALLENDLAIADSNTINLDNSPAMPNGIPENDDAIVDSLLYNNNGPSVATGNAIALDDKYKPLSDGITTSEDDVDVSNSKEMTFGDYSVSTANDSDESDECCYEKRAGKADSEEDEEILREEILDERVGLQDEEINPVEDQFVIGDDTASYKVPDTAPVVTEEMPENKYNGVNGCQINLKRLYERNVPIDMVPFEACTYITVEYGVFTDQCEFVLVEPFIEIDQMLSNLGRQKLMWIDMNEFIYSINGGVSMSQECQIRLIKSIMTYFPRLNYSGVEIAYIPNVTSEEEIIAYIGFIEYLSMILHSENYVLYCWLPASVKYIRDYPLRYMTKFVNFYVLKTFNYIDGDVTMVTTYLHPTECPIDGNSIEELVATVIEVGIERRRIIVEISLTAIFYKTQQPGRKYSGAPLDEQPTFGSYYQVAASDGMQEDGAVTYVDIAEAVEIVSYCISNELGGVHLNSIDQDIIRSTNDKTDEMPNFPMAVTLWNVMNNPCQLQDRCYRDLVDEKLVYKIPPGQCG